MNSIDFRRLAKEAGFKDHYSADMWGVMLAHDIEVERFAKLVAEAEREACATLCFREAAFVSDLIDRERIYQCAAAIRARSNND